MLKQKRYHMDTMVDFSFCDWKESAEMYPIYRLFVLAMEPLPLSMKNTPNFSKYNSLPHEILIAR
jgi:hypothetical protein